MTVGTTRDGIRECIADCLDREAGWREALAKEHPDDERATAAEAMRACASYVRHLPTDDARIVRLRSAWSESSFTSRDRICEIDFEDESRLLGQIGFRDDCGPSDHLDQIVEFCLARTVTMRALFRRMNRRLVKGGLKLLTTRSPRMIASVGDHYIVDKRRNRVFLKHVKVEELARELGVLRSGERVAR